MSTSYDGDECPLNSENVANDDAKQEISPGSGYGTCSGKGAEVQSYNPVLEGTTPDSTAYSDSICASPESSPSAMGNLLKCGSSKLRGDAKEARIARDREKASAPKVSIPQIAVIGASPLPVGTDDTSFFPPERRGFDGQESKDVTSKNEFGHDKSTGAAGGAGQPAPGREAKAKVSEEDTEAAVSKGAPLAQVINRRRVSRGSQRSMLSSNPSEDGAEDGQFDFIGMSGYDSNTPKSSRKNFIELMMNSSPQVRRSMVHRNSTYLLSRHRDRDSVRSDSDSASLISSTTDEDGGSVMLDPLEHEWMMCASDGQWESLHRLLISEPNLVTKKDFVTGFTCLHWAAKQGKQELLALLVTFAKQHDVPLNINVRSSAGYTPLHLAAMHSHIEVVKLLVGAYDADVEARDYSGKKASQYLTNTVAKDIRDIIGAAAEPCAESVESKIGRWRLSRDDAPDGGGFSKSVVVQRMQSMSKIKPRLQKIRFRTQIIHSTSFREADDMERSLKSPSKLRPISNLFG